MALADYYLCDVCGAKCFYDANLNWEESTRRNPIPEDQLVRGHRSKLDYCGDMACICRDCAKTHSCVVIPCVPVPADNPGEVILNFPKS